MRFKQSCAVVLLGHIPFARSHPDASITFSVSNPLSHLVARTGFRLSKGRLPLELRGGAVEEDISQDDYDDYDEYDEYDSSDEESDAPIGDVNEGNESCLEPFFMSPSIQLYTTFGCMILGNKIDMFSPFVVKIIRYGLLFVRSDHIVQSIV
jgi:hypothetical protein